MRLLDITMIGVGVGVASGLQNFINNFVSGLIILAERPITIRDQIEVGSIAGQVTRISPRSTTVVTNDNISIIVPNSEFTTHAVTNWSHADLRVRIRLPLGVAYGTDPQKVRQVCWTRPGNAPVCSLNRRRNYFSAASATARWILSLACGPRKYPPNRAAFAVISITPARKNCATTASKFLFRSAICISARALWSFPRH